MTILILILVFSAATAALLSWAFGPCEALWWFILRIPLLFCAAFVAWTVLYILTLFVVAQCVNTNKPVKKAHHGFRWVLTETAQFLLLIGLVRIHAEGLERVDRSKPFLLVANHRSNFDPFVALTLFKGTEILYICKPSIFKMPVAGGIAHMSGFLSINREDNREGLKTILRAVEILKDEQTAVAVYPEGTRNKADAPLLPFRAGAFAMAKRGKCPIVVAFTEHTGDVARRYLRKPTVVNFTVLDVLPYEQIKDMQTDAISETVRERMETYMNRQERSSVS